MCLVQCPVSKVSFTVCNVHCSSTVIFCCQSRGGFDISGRPALRCGADWCSVVQYCSLPGRQPKGSLLIGSSLVSVQCSVHGCLASREGCTPHRLGHSPTIPSHFAGSLYQISITLSSLVTNPTLFMFYPAISEKCSFYQTWPLAALQILLLL